MLCVMILSLIFVIVGYDSPDDRNREPSLETALPPKNAPKPAYDVKTHNVDSSGDELGESGLANNGVITSNTDGVCYYDCHTVQSNTYAPRALYNNPLMIFQGAVTPIVPIQTPVTRSKIVIVGILF